MYDRNKFSFVVLTAFVFLFSIICISLSSSYGLDEESPRWSVSFNAVNVVDSTASLYDEVKLKKASTSLSKLGFIFDNAGDTITYRINVLNSGNIDAVISSILLSRAVCSDDAYCDNLDYSLTYENGSDVSRGDILPKNSGVVMLLKFTHVGNEQNGEVTIKDIDFSINYTEG
jgi:hypothetical protein